VLALGGAGAAEADEGISTTVSGYGTVGGTFTSDSNFAYRHDPGEFVGASNQFDIGLESRLGLQALVDFGSGFSVTVQELARERGSDVFSLGTEWAYVQYAPTSDLKVRLGRVALSTFLISESREVGYAQPWFRSPNEVSGVEPFYYMDGGEVLRSHSVGPVQIGLVAGYGNSQTSLVINDQPLDIKANAVFNASATIQYGSFMVRVAQTDLHNPITIPLSATFSESYEVADKFTSVGLQYDDGKAIVMSEWAKRSQNVGPGLPLPLAASKQWYAGGGWRFGKLTPMVIYGESEDEATLLTPAGNSGTWYGSLRYDVAQNIALKAEVSRPQAKNSTYWITTDFTSDKRVNVYSLGADFVF